SAVPAHEVVVVMAVRVDGLVAGDAVTQVDACQQALSGQEVENPVHRGDSDPRSGRTNALARLLRGQTAILALQVLHHSSASTTAAVAGVAKALERVRRPRQAVGGRSRHVENDTRYRRRGTLVSGERTPAKRGRGRTPVSRCLVRLHAGPSGSPG